MLCNAPCRGHARVFPIHPTQYCPYDLDMLTLLGASGSHLLQHATHASIYACLCRNETLTLWMSIKVLHAQLIFQLQSFPYDPKYIYTVLTLIYLSKS